MKKYLASLALVLVSVTAVVAQGNPWGNGNPGNNGQGGPQNGWNNNNNSQGPVANAQQVLLNYLLAGNPVPSVVALDIIRQARDWGMQECGLNLGQMIQKYFQGQLTVAFVATAPPSWTFRVSFGGHDVLVIDSF